MGGSILVADDEAGIRDLLEWELGGGGYEVTTAASGSEALEILRRGELDVVISDVRMPGLNGLEVLRWTKELSPDTEVIVTTGYGELETALECLRGGAFDLVLKPFDLGQLLATVARALERRELRRATALYQASHAIFASREPQRLPEEIVAVAMRVMVADDVSLMVPDASGSLRLLHSHGLAPEIQAEARAALGERVAGRVAQSREPALLPDALGSDPRFVDVPSFGRVRSSIVYPLFSGDRLLGVLNVSRVQNPRPFRKGDLERASVLAAHVTLALDNLRLIQQVAASERLGAIGQLAAGVAHEINNPLSCLLAGHTYLREGLEDLGRFGELCQQGADLQALRECWRGLGGFRLVEEVRQALADAEEGAGRIRDIVGDMVSLARTEEHHGLVDLNVPIQSALRLAGAELRHRASVVSRLGSGVVVRGSSGRLSQVFLNLLVNASQALDEGARGHNEVLVASERRGDQVVASIRDNGVGVLPEHLPRIFEAFFTTKGQTSGTGLGLSISREIIQRHGGEIRVESTPGVGTTFTVVLPAADALDRTVPPADASAARAPARGGNASSARLRILFIDDESAILRAYERAFGRDCAIATADSGRKALALVAERGHFDLVVCDMELPDLGGMELYRQITGAHPELARAFVFVTGAAGRKDVQSFLRATGNQALGKPFDISALRNVVAAHRASPSRGGGGGETR